MPPVAYVTEVLPDGNLSLPMDARRKLRLSPGQQVTVSLSKVVSPRTTVEDSPSPAEELERLYCKRMREQPEDLTVAHTGAALAAQMASGGEW